MKLLVYYTALVLLGTAVAAVVCLGIEKIVPPVSMPIFLIAFFVILWGAWVLAVKWSDPEAQSATAVDGAVDQKA